MSGVVGSAKLAEAARLNRAEAGDCGYRISPLLGSRPASSIVPVRSAVASPLGPQTTHADEGVFSICAPTASVLPNDLRGLKYKSPNCVTEDHVIPQQRPTTE
jgi:hypothetical protein